MCQPSDNSSDPPLLSLLLAVVAMLTLVGVTGCSRVGLAYHTADFFIERYADDYLSPSSAQLAAWRPLLARVLARHRAEELPYLAAFFDLARQQAQQGFTEAGVRCLIGHFEELYRRHLRLASELAAPLLATAGPEQLRALKRKFGEDATIAAINFEERAARRARKRAKRYVESVEWWTGKLSEEQRELVRQVALAIPDRAPDWEGHQRSQQQRLLAMLDRGATEAELYAYLLDWLVTYRDAPESLAAARRELQQAMIDLFVGLDVTLTEAQRRHLVQRLQGLRDDFLSLQKRSQLAPLTCV